MGVSGERLESLDLTRPVWNVAFEATPGRVVGSVGAAASGIRRGLDEATALLCAEMEGGMRKVLETAIDYAAERFANEEAIGHLDRALEITDDGCTRDLIDVHLAREAVLDEGIQVFAEDLGGFDDRVHRLGQRGEGMEPVKDSSLILCFLFAFCFVIFASVV